MNLQLQAGYFSIKSPVKIIDRWLNPFRHLDTVDIRGKNMAILYSKRATEALLKRNSPLIAELQLYFTCVVQKRVLFHDMTEQPTIKTNNNLEILYRAVQSDSCDPVDFAQNHPVKKELQSKGAQHMRPNQLKIDYIKGQWLGEFNF